MSILTKIAIVILLVLVLVASVVFTNQAVLVPNYKEAYLRETEKTAAALEQARQANWIATRAKIERDRAVDKADSMRKNQQQKIDDLTTRLDQAQKQHVTLHTDLMKVREDLGQLQESYQAAQARLKELDDQRKVLLTKNTELQEENRNMTAQLKDALAQVSRLEKVAKVLREELAGRDEIIRDMAAKIRKLEESGAKVATKGPGPVEPAATVPIEGTVTSVKNDVASINVGSAKGVKTGMRLILFRGDKFVANLRVEEVDINEAVGLIIDRKLDPVVGDKVMSR